jgi:hypothetical protein
MTGKVNGGIMSTSIRVFPILSTGAVSLVAMAWLSLAGPAQARTSSDWQAIAPGAETFGPDNVCKKERGVPSGVTRFLWRREAPALTGAFSHLPPQVLAQSAESQLAEPPQEPRRRNEPEKRQELQKEQSSQKRMEERMPAPDLPPDTPANAGTRKFGAQPIRSKEHPEGE